MALLKRRKMKKETARKQRYLKHYKKAGVKHAMTYAEWLKKGETHAYYKVPRLRRKSIEARMRESGMTTSDRKSMKEGN